jgi:hypothetical protein
MLWKGDEKERLNLENMHVLINFMFQEIGKRIGDEEGEGIGDVDAYQSYLTMLIFILFYLFIVFL